MLKAGNPQNVLDSLHTLLQSIMTLYKIARYYGTPQRMTILFSKITNQMIRLCKDSILAPGKLWDQDKATLIANMQVCSTRGQHPASSLGVMSAGKGLTLPCVLRAARSCVCGCVKPTSSSTSPSGMQQSWTTPTR